MLCRYWNNFVPTSTGHVPAETCQQLCAVNSRSVYKASSRISVFHSVGVWKLALHAFEIAKSLLLLFYDTYLLIKCELLRRSHLLSIIMEDPTDMLPFQVGYSPRQVACKGCKNFILINCLRLAVIVLVGTITKYTLSRNYISRNWWVSHWTLSDTASYGDKKSLASFRVFFQLL